MSLVVFDGNSIAADRAIFNAGVRSPFEKLVPVENVEGKTYLVGSVGTLAGVMEFRAWLASGDGPAPKVEGSEHIVIDVADGTWLVYEMGYSWLPELPHCIGAKAVSSAALALSLDGRAPKHVVEFLLATDRFEDIGFGVTAYDLEGQKLR